MVVTAIPRGTPSIKNFGQFNGKYYWDVEVPILVQYESISDSVKSNFIIKMIIERIPSEKSGYGIGISLYSVRNG